MGQRSLKVIESGTIWKFGYDLLPFEGAIFNDLEQPQTQISRSGHSLRPNISEMAKDTAVVTMEGE